MKRASRKYSRISYLERTTNEPGRRQTSEVNNPNRPTSARHTRTSGLMERNSTGIFETTAGATDLHQRKARAQQGPTPRLELQLLTASFAYRLHMKTHTSKGLSSLNRLDFITLQAKFASFSPTWGNPKQARGSPKLLGLTRKAHRELKGMISSYSQFNR